MLVPLGLAAGLATLAVGQALAETADRRRYAPPGRLVRLGGVQLHLWEMGADTPTVVLESGTGGFCLEWFRVMPEIATTARVVAIDRPGFGWSDADPGPADALVAARRLRALLITARLPGPYVLVGRALGGMVVRAFAGSYPEETAGLVLLDAVHEDEQHRILPVLRNRGRRELALAALLRWFAPFGLVRLALHLGLRPKLDVLATCPEWVRAPMDASLARSSFLDAIYREFAACEVNAAAVRALPCPRDLPLAVLAAGAHLNAHSFPPEFPLDDCQRIWEQLQGELAHLSTDATFQVMKGVGHYLAIECPDPVVAAVRSVVARARSRLQL